MTDVVLTLAQVTCTIGPQFPHLLNEVAGLGDCGYLLSFLDFTSPLVMAVGQEPSAWPHHPHCWPGEHGVSCVPHTSQSGSGSCFKACRPDPFSSPIDCHHQARAPDPSGEGRQGRQSQPAQLSTWQEPLDPSPPDTGGPGPLPLPGKGSLLSGIPIC